MKQSVPLYVNNVDASLDVLTDDDGRIANHIVGGTAFTANMLLITEGGIKHHFARAVKMRIGVILVADGESAGDVNKLPIEAVDTLFESFMATMCTLFGERKIVEVMLNKVGAMAEDEPEESSDNNQEQLFPH